MTKKSNDDNKNDKNEKVEEERDKFEFRVIKMKKR